MTCKQCGSAADEALTLCPDCGAELTDGAPEALTDEAAAPDAATPAEEAEGPAAGTDVWEAAPPDGDFLAAAPQPAARRRGLVPFLVSLGVVVALAVGAFFLFFADNLGTDEARIDSLFNRFVSQLSAGNISGLRKCLPSGYTVGDGDLLLLGTQDSVAASLAAGGFGQAETVNANDAGALMRAAVKQLNFRAALTRLTLDDSKTIASAYVIYTIDLPGGVSSFTCTISFVKQNGKWLIDNYTPLSLGPDELTGLTLFARFTGSLKAGDLAALNECLLPDYRMEGDYVPFVGTLADAQGYAEAGFMGDMTGVDMNDAGAVTQRYLANVQWELLFSGLAMDSEESGTISVFNSEIHDGELYEDMDVYYLVLQDGVWYLV
ncbi:MAG: hypothetical protein LBT60_02085 [Oscillospiraceae bacterium]|jgi:hypothetical protein|nr:hypothetical protein [Oscillospiraceae bacterium]